MANDDRQTDDYRRRYLDLTERGYSDAAASQLAGEEAYGLGKTPRTWKETGEEMFRGGGLAVPYAKQQLTDLYHVAQAAEKADKIASGAMSAYMDAISAIAGAFPGQSNPISRMKPNEFIEYLDSVGAYEELGEPVRRFSASTLRDSPEVTYRMIRRDPMDFEPMSKLTPYDSMSKKMDHLPIEKQAEIREHLGWAEPHDRGLPFFFEAVPPEDIRVESGDDLVDQMPRGMIRKGDWK